MVTGQNVEWVHRSSGADRMPTFRDIDAARAVVGMVPYLVHQDVHTV